MDKIKQVQYLTARGLEWREDMSNNEPKYKRNLVRLRLIPLLQV